MSTDAFADWAAEIQAELEARTANPTVGTRLVLEDEHVRLWEVRLAAGERLAFHRHVLDYVWLCVSGGSARSHDGEGRTHDVTYDVGEARRLSFAAG